MGDLTGILKGKKGVCVALKEEGNRNSHARNLPKVKSLHSHWFYNWGTKVSDGVETKIQAKGNACSPLMHFIPMVWGCNRHFEKHLIEAKE